MSYAQFYTTKVNGKPVQAKGDHAILELDDDAPRAKQHRVAFGEAVSRGFIGYTLHKAGKQIASFVSVDCRGLKSTSEG